MQIFECTTGKRLNKKSWEVRVNDILRAVYDHNPTADDLERLNKLVEQFPLAGVMIREVR